MKVIIVGGGWSGCAAAISAKKAGADVTVIEKPVLWLGLEKVGGKMRIIVENKEQKELMDFVAGDFIKILEKVSFHTM